MKKLLATVALLFFLVGCQSNGGIGGQVVIDWVDFVKVNDTFYEGIHTGVLADENNIGEVIGTVEFTVATNVTDPNYKVKNGDAAFHEEGTEIYEVKGHPQLIAIKNDRMINNYTVYFNRDELGPQWYFKDMPKDAVEKVEFYFVDTKGESQQLSTWGDGKIIQDIVDLLVESKEDVNFVPDTSNSDPTYYEVVFYTDEPIAYKYTIQFDGTTYYWDPWSTNTLSNEIETYLNKE